MAKVSYKAGGGAGARIQASAAQPLRGHKAIEVLLVPGNGIERVLTALSLLQQLRGQQCWPEVGRRMLVFGRSKRLMKGGKLALEHCPRWEVTS